ncbi:MAG: TonB-dependent receptor plug domain-containing protein [Prevotellaceae bacterium]|nr:TonB-dependent receptor plug domain-containing protein [Prevotellaceae bacterium]
MKKILIFACWLAGSAVIFAGDEAVEGFVFRDKKAVPGLVITNSVNDKTEKTNRKGYFRIKGLSTESDTISVSGLIDMETLIIPLWGANQIKIRQTGDSVFVERDRKKAPPSSAYGGTIVTREALELTGEINLLRAISRKVPGVEYANENLIIRGLNSINSSVYPLYILDGVETSQVAFLTVMEVETVEVLKDASTSMFGVRGGNGVVIINRKK